MNTVFTKDTKFNTGSFEPVTLLKIVDRIHDFLSDGYDYSIDIGTDSQRNGKTKFITAIVVHKIGKGGIFFYHPTINEQRQSLADRIYMETALSINCANELIDLFVNKDMLYNITIHCDVGEHGKTRELIKGIIGYVTSSGFECKIKPESSAASCVADRFSK